MSCPRDGLDSPGQSGLCVYSTFFSRVHGRQRADNARDNLAGTLLLART
jgi:hypothetical protein